MIHNLTYSWTSFLRKQCGPDFQKAMIDGRVTVSFTDTFQIYEPYGIFNKQDGSQSSVGISWRVTQILEQDTPWTKKKGVITKNMKKDQVQVVFEGLDQVTWKTNFENCITKGKNKLDNY